ncbi:MAG: CoB--CoM heterodisulfide reductase iron-sulfur subunit B family protein [Promethearchaeota archaeon]
MGCVIANRYPYIEQAGRKVLDNLQVALKEVGEFSCCPNPTGVKQMNQDLWSAMAANNLCLAEKENANILTMCNGCYETLKSANVELKEDEEHKERVNEILKKTGKEFKGTVDVIHFLEYVVKYIPTDILKKSFTHPLSNLKVATFYGCHYGRPSNLLDFDDPLRPTSMDKVVEMMGATSVEYLKKYTCCGSAISGINPDAQLQLLYDKLVEIEKVGADCILVICPACYMQFENQRAVNKKFGTNFKIPVLFLPEMMALAQGVDPKSLGFKFHPTKLKEFLEKV